MGQRQVSVAASPGEFPASCRTQGEDPCDPIPTIVILVEDLSALDGTSITVEAHRLRGRLKVRIVDSLDSLLASGLVGVPPGTPQAAAPGSPARPAIPLSGWIPYLPSPKTLAGQAVLRIPGLANLTVKCLRQVLGVSASTIERSFRATGLLTAGGFIWAYTEALVLVCHRAGWSLAATVRAADRVNGRVLRRAFRLRGRPFPEPWPMTRTVRPPTDPVAWHSPRNSARMPAATAGRGPRLRRGSPREAVKARRA